MLRKLKKIKKRYIILFGIILALVLFFVLRNNSKNDYTEYVVARVDVSDELLLAGTIDAKKRVNLGFASSGRVLKNNFEVGDLVKKGDVIAELSQNRLQSDLLQARAGYTVIQADANSDVSSVTDSYETRIAEQDTLIKGLYQQYLSGDLQAYSVDEASRGANAPVVSGTYQTLGEGDYYLDIYSSSSPSGYSFRLTGLENETYTGEVNQPGRLGERGLYIQFDENSSYANSEWVVSIPNTRSNTYLVRKTAYENALRGRDAIVAEVENSLERTTGVGTNTGFSKTDAQKKQAQAQVNAVYAQLGDGKITAPFDGLVAKNNLEVGETVSAFDAQVVLFGDLEKELVLNVPEIYINKVALGDEVRINLDAYPEEEFMGLIDFIDFIDTNVDGVPVYQIDIDLMSEDDRIRVGMNAKASIVSAKSENVIAVPGHYVSENADGELVVLVMNNLEPVERKVGTGLKGNAGLTEIISGLEVGNIILVEKE